MLLVLLVLLVVLAVLVVLVVVVVVVVVVKFIVSTIKGTPIARPSSTHRIKPIGIAFFRLHNVESSSRIRGRVSNSTVLSVHGNWF